MGVQVSGNVYVNTFGPLAAVQGGTGQSSYTVGDLLYADSTTTLAKLAVGTNGQVLTLAAGVPSWAAGGGGSVIEPDTQIVYGTGSGVDSSSTFTYNPLTGGFVLDADPSATPARIRLFAAPTTAAATQGGGVSIKAGSSQVFTGGDIDITAGIGTTTNGGQLSLSGGAGDVNGGEVFISGGTATSATGGIVRIWGGDGFTGGYVSMVAGASTDVTGSYAEIIGGTTPNGPAGSASVIGGQGTGAQDAGAAFLQGGDAPSTGLGGAATVEGGVGQQGGWVNIIAGQGDTQGGEVLITGGAGVHATAGVGGAINISGGNGTDTPGDVYILGGSNTHLTDPNPGGGAFVEGGDGANGGNQGNAGLSGGSVSINSSTADPTSINIITAFQASGPSGGIRITVGDSTDGDAGFAWFKGGEATGDDIFGSSISIESGSQVGDNTGWPSTDDAGAGSVSLVAGGVTGTGRAGDVSLIAGNSSAGHAGSILMSAGTGDYDSFSGAYGSITFQVDGTIAFRMIPNKNVLLGQASLATNATSGFPYFPTCAGVPTGSPQNMGNGHAPVVIDITNSKMYFHDGTSWVALN